jgi:hypothetical protein
MNQFQMNPQLSAVRTQLRCYKEGTKESTNERGKEQMKEETAT